MPPTTVSPPPLPPISFKRKRWTLHPPGDSALTAALAQQLRQPLLLAQLLTNRGLTDPDAARAFLNPPFKQMHEPALLPNMAAAVERILRAVKDKEKITLFGDYDVDGITGTAMLWHTLTTAGANVSYYIPHRVDEGYGLSCDAIQQLINSQTQLIISIDCGVSAVQPIAVARQNNVDVIITDHHEIGPTLPNANAIIHPRLSVQCPVSSVLNGATKDWTLDTGRSPPPPKYPNENLCGAGVAFKLAWALASALCGGGKVSETYRNLLIEFAALVGLGTIADVVPLTGENRIIAAFGLRQLPRTTLPGLQALIHSAGFTDRKIDGMAVGFSLAPRLNAAGRMGHAKLAVELLTTATGDRAQEIADYLEEQNRDRQATEKKIAEAAKKEIDALPQLPDAIVVCSEAFHAGVVGIVASRLVDAYHRPSFVLACENGIAHGSARTVPGYDLHTAIDHCRDLLISGGGHAMAGGVKLKTDNLPAFKERLNAHARSILGPDGRSPEITVDALAALSDLTVPFVRQLAAFEPHGPKNPHPKLVILNARLTAPPRPVGATGSHLQLQLNHEGILAKAIAFRMGELAPALFTGLELDLVVEPKISEWNNEQRVELHVIDLARSDHQPLLPAS